MQGNLKKTISNSQNFCNFIAFWQQKQVFVGDDAEQQHTNGIHSHCHADGAKDGNRIAKEPCQQPVRQGCRNAHDNGAEGGLEEQGEVVRLLRYRPIDCGKVQNGDQRIADQ